MYTTGEGGEGNEVPSIHRYSFLPWYGSSVRMCRRKAAYREDAYKRVQGNAILATAMTVM
jgi:hypothetical protein